MHLVLAAAVAELLELETASGRLLVLRRRVVPLLALSALQCHDFPHLLILTDPAILSFPPPNPKSLPRLKLLRPKGAFARRG
jgi:hypothetical protein